MTKHQTLFKTAGSRNCKETTRCKAALNRCHFSVMFMSNCFTWAADIYKKIKVRNVELFSLRGIVRLSGGFTVKPQSDL